MTTVTSWSEDPEELLVSRGWNVLKQRADDVGQHITMIRSAAGKNRYSLTPREFQVTYLAGIGITGKQAAAELSMAWTTTRATLSSALGKLGLQRCAYVPAFWHALSTGERSVARAGDVEVVDIASRFTSHDQNDTLTLAERDILLAVIVGSSSQEIAQHRNTSERTVANQLAALFQKFGVSTRHELAARALCLMPAVQHGHWVATKTFRRCARRQPRAPGR